MLRLRLASSSGGLPPHGCSQRGSSRPRDAVSLHEWDACFTV